MLGIMATIVTGPEPEVVGGGYIKRNPPAPERISKSPLSS